VKEEVNSLASMLRGMTVMHLFGDFTLTVDNTTISQQPLSITVTMHFISKINEAYLLSLIYKISSPLVPTILSRGVCLKQPL